MLIRFETPGFSAEPPPGPVEGEQGHEEPVRRDLLAAGGLPGELHKLWRAGDAASYHVEYGYSCMGYEIAGGLGGAVAELLGEQAPMPVKRLGVEDRYGETGSPRELLEAFELTGEHLAAYVS